MSTPTVGYTSQLPPSMMTDTMTPGRAPYTFDNTAQAWIWDDLLWLPDIS